MAARPAVRFGVVIPARYASSRLPGKPLRLLAGKPMIEHVVRNAERAGAGFVVVATDDGRIADAVAAFGGDVVMTSNEHESGTDRIAEVARARGLDEGTIVVNLQGDEPLLPGALLVSVARALETNPSAGLSTLATPIRQGSDVFEPNVVKVVMDGGGFALYFSRAPIPWVRGVSGVADPARALEHPAGVYRHLGLYAYRTGTLLRLADAAPCALEQAESLEQLRALWLGIRIHVTVVHEAPGHGVDTPEDLARVERALLARLENE